MLARSARSYRGKWGPMHRLVEGLRLGDRYVLQERIASGGMADVWRGIDDVLKRDVAVKVMRADPDNEQIFAERFRDEALHSAALLHTNITTVFDYGQDDHRTYLVMELVEGLPLSAIMARCRPSRCARSSVRRPSPSARPTRRAWCTATSNRPTSSSARTGW
jgi:serine/threonine protein kinase